MVMPLASILGLSFALSEAALGIFKHAKAGKSRTVEDRGSLRALWLVIAISVSAAYGLAQAAPAWRIGGAAAALDAGITLFVAGLALRWYSIVVLGRFFTVNVAIAADHRLIDTGPYRFVRHPSYAGALMAIFGLGLYLCNWASLAATVVPTLLVFSWRMHVEEVALAAALGDRYLAYMRRTRRLIPGIY